MSADLVYLLAGLALLLAVVLPVALSSLAISSPIVLVLAGTLIGLLPLPEGVSQARPLGPFGPDFGPGRLVDRMGDVRFQA